MSSSGESWQSTLIMISLKIIFLFNSIYFALQTTYKYVPYINQMRIISRSRRYLQIWPAAFTFRATAVQTGLINFVTVLTYGSQLLHWYIKRSHRRTITTTSLLLSTVEYRVNNWHMEGSCILMDVRVLYGVGQSTCICMPASCRLVVVVVV